MTTLVRTIKATSKAGNKIEIEITRTIGVEANDISLDGFVFASEKMIDRTWIIVRVDGEKYTSSSETPAKLSTTGMFADSDRPMIEKGGYARLGKMILTEERYNEIMAAIAEMEAELATPEYEAHLVAEEEAKSCQEAEDREIEKQIAERNTHPGWCNKCHSYCWGDCQSN